MNKKLKDKPFDEIQSREEMEECVRSLCYLSIKENEVKTRMDEELARVKDRYMAELAEIKTNTSTELDRAHDWAERHPQEFGTKKSIVFVHGTAGFRTGTPKLKPLRGFTWAMVLDIVRNKFPEYVRRKEDVDREKIIRDKIILSDTDLRKMGVKVEQDESFYVDPNREAFGK